MAHTYIQHVYICQHVDTMYVFIHAYVVSIKGAAHSKAHLPTFRHTCIHIYVCIDVCICLCLSV